MTAPRTRREPPRFRRLEVKRTDRVGPRLVSVTLGGAELDGFLLADPAASVRVLLPRPEAVEPEVPAWRGNEFLLPDGSRPTIRTLTPRRHNPGGHELEVQVVLHGSGAVSEWAESVEAGAVVAVSGPGRGYAVEADAPGFLVAGDETAIPAMSQLLESLPPERPVQVLVEVATPDGRVELPAHPAATVEWLDRPGGEPPGSTLLAAIRASTIELRTKVWAAGEAAGVQRIRRHLFDERDVARADATVRGYWKAGRAGGDGEGSG